MRIIALNLWGGKMLDPLLAFLRNEAGATDVFCFQEVFNSPEERFADGVPAHLFTLLCETLPDHVGVFSPVLDGEMFELTVDFPVSLGLAIFVRKNLHLRTNGDFFVYKRRGWMSREVRADHGRALQYVSLSTEGGELWVMNVHGRWTKDKEDTPENIEQCKAIASFVRTKGTAVLCGDFNLMPHTRSIAILDEGMRDLIKDFKITTTRSELYTKPLRFADYTFVKNVDVKNFFVPHVAVSDHLPMIVEF